MGPKPKSPFPNPQSPIPTPQFVFHKMKIFKYF